MNAAERRAWKLITQWFHERGFRPSAFQREAWQAYLDGCHGLIHAATGTGKTLAVFGGCLLECLAYDERLADACAQIRSLPKGPEPDAPTSILRVRGTMSRLRRPRTPARDRGLRVLWVTPLRALATDTEQTLDKCCRELGLPWRVEKRTGDTTASVRQRQKEMLPEILVTTPESLTLQLSYADSATRLERLRLLVVDEWHELLGSRRGVQTELALARIRRLCPNTRVWGLSATLADPAQALETLLGVTPSSAGAPRKARLICGPKRRLPGMKSIIPRRVDRFPWSGHLGLRLVREVAAIVETAATSIVFTNTRSQTEYWYRALLQEQPDLAGRMAVHHGSIDLKLRRWIEDRMREGSLKCCVATSSLDLGVDFATVDHVIQIGSPKGIGRMLQRAGRSGHQPDGRSRVTLVPTNALELIEFSALKAAATEGAMEHRQSLSKPLDVLAQHLVTMSLAGGFVASELLAEVRSTQACRHLTDREWEWILDFVTTGGHSLRAYPDYSRVVLRDGRYHVASPKIARLHRMSVGTIVSDVAISVRFVGGRRLGTVEESFISRMKPGDIFMLDGRTLKFVRVHETVAWVRAASGPANAIPRWSGGRMPLSSALSHGMRQQLQAARAGRFDSREMRAVRPLLQLQQAWSALPDQDETLIEVVHNRFGHHLFLYPFEGRLVHEGLAALAALRLSRIRPLTVTMAMNDYGLVLTCDQPLPSEEMVLRILLSSEGLADDILSGVNATEMARRQFREIARVAGLVFQGYPGQPKSSRHLQASSNLFFEVFAEYDADNLLLEQARREVLEQQLEQHRLQQTLERIERSRLVIRHPPQTTPFGFSLLVDQLRDRVSSETLSTRVERMQRELEQAADRQSTDTMQTGTARDED